ncbi:MAG: hypothetical protein Sw1PiTSA_26670 [Shewanella algae]
MNPLNPKESLVNPDLLEMYKHPLASSRTGPLYNAFSYPTKISPEAIALYIATHTRVGQTVMDTFGGSGTTGLAAKLCDKPTARMLSMADELGLKPEWGPRNAIIYELGCVGSFVAEVMCNPPDAAKFADEASALIESAYAKLKPLLSVTDDQGQSGILRHAIWSEVLVCPCCEHEHTFWDAAVKVEPVRLRNTKELYTCPNCSSLISIDVTKRAIENYFDPLLGKFLERRKRVLKRIYGRTGTRKWQRPATAQDNELLKKIEEYPLPNNIPTAELILGDLYRSGYHFGITHLHHLYTCRNLICLGTLFELIEERDPSVRDALKLLVLSYNQSHSTLMTRVVVKKGQSDFVLTGAQSGVLYISSLPVEKNILEGLARKVKPLKDSFKLISGSKSQVTVRNQSSTHLAEANASIDYIFTDPPFADFIPYSEINQINELWLGVQTSTDSEAIVSSAQGKSLEHYTELMSEVFAEISRVIKPEGLATVVFHAAKASVWKALQESYRSADLEVVAANVLDKLQASFKQVVSTVSVKGDPLLLLAKSSAKICQETTGEMILSDVIKEAYVNKPSEREFQHVYSKYVSKCLELGIEVEFNAGEVYRKVREALAK